MHNKNLDGDKRYIKDSVELLKRKGIIQYDSDIAKELRYSRGAVSELLNPHSGKPMTYPFMKKFKDAYGKYLDELRDSEENDLSSHVEERISTLEAQMRVLKESLVAIISESKGKHPALVSAELDEAVRILKK